MKNTDVLPFSPVDDVWERLKAEKRPIVVYGMGNGADKLIARFERYGIGIADFFASDGFVRGHSFHGKRVKSFSEIRSEYPDFVIVVSFASNRREVISMLSEISKQYDLVMPDMPIAGDEYFDLAYFRGHSEELGEAYLSLADEESRAIFSSVVEQKLYGKIEPILSVYTEKKDYYRTFGEVKAYLDVGAYRGDTVKEAIEEFRDLEEIFAMEPDAKNFAKLEAFASGISSCKIECIPAAAWSQNGFGTFSQSGNRNSTLVATASFEATANEIRLQRIDSLNLPKIDLIKYDVEGAEREALEGSDGVILRDRPILSVSAYHRSEDIFGLLLMLKKRYPFYRFLLRRTLCLPAWEISLICLPQNK